MTRNRFSFSFALVLALGIFGSVVTSNVAHADLDPATPGTQPDEGPMARARRLANLKVQEASADFKEVKADLERRSKSTQVKDALDLLDSAQLKLGDAVEKLAEADRTADVTLAIAAYVAAGNLANDGSDHTVDPPVDAQGFILKAKTIFAKLPKRAGARNSSSSPPSADPCNDPVFAKAHAGACR